MTIDEQPQTPRPGLAASSSSPARPSSASSPTAPPTASTATSSRRSCTSAPSGSRRRCAPRSPRPTCPARPSCSATASAPTPSSASRPARHPRRAARGRLHRHDAGLQRGVLRRVREGARQLLRRQGVSGRVRHHHERAREARGEARPRAGREDDAPAAQALHAHRAHRHRPLRPGAVPGARRRVRRDASTSPSRRSRAPRASWTRSWRAAGATTSSSPLPATSSRSQDFRPELFAGDAASPPPAAPDGDQPA